MARIEPLSREARGLQLGAVRVLAALGEASTERRCVNCRPPPASLQEPSGAISWRFSAQELVTGGSRPTWTWEVTRSGRRSYWSRAIKVRAPAERGGGRVRSRRRIQVGTSSFADRPMPSHEVARVHAEGDCDAHQVCERRARLAPLDVADVRAMDAGGLSESLLG